MKSKLPTSRAKTAYGLLSDVCRVIVAEPKRYAQSIYIERANEPFKQFDEHPACGTIGCVAGWVATLKTQRRFRYHETPVIAKERLGINEGQAMELFGESVAGVAQTMRHAHNGVAHIRKFQKKYRAQLLAKKVR